MNPCFFIFVRTSSELKCSWFFWNPMQIQICSEGVRCIAFWAGRKNFNSKHLPLKTMSVTEPSKGRLNASFIFLNQSSTNQLQAWPGNSSTETTLHKALISFLTWEAVSEKFRQPSLLTSLRLSTSLKI